MGVLGGTVGVVGALWGPYGGPAISIGSLQGSWGHNWVPSGVWGSLWGRDGGPGVAMGGLGVAMVILVSFMGSLWGQRPFKTTEIPTVGRGPQRAGPMG